MTTAPVKPWSPIDDDSETDADRASRASSASDPTKRAGVEPMTPGTQPRSAAQSWSARATTWAFVPLGLAFCIHVWNALASSPRTSTGIVAGLSVGVGMAAAAVLMVLGRRARRAASRRLASDILSSRSHGTGQVSQARIPDDIRPVWNAVHEHLDSVDSRLAELKEQQRDLAMERSLSDVQKRNTVAIIDSISDAVLVTDDFDRIVLANPAAAAIFGFDRAGSLRRPVTDVVSDEPFLRALRQVRDSSGAATKRRIEHAIGDRTYALTLSQVSAQRVANEPSGEARGVVAVMRDITKDREVSRLKSDFVSQVSHELRTPLSSIRAYVELLVDGEAADEETRREYYDVIQTSAERLTRLIDNMLNISRIESGTVRINKEPVAASMVVRDALDVMRPQAEDKRIRLTDELSPVMFRVRADRDLLYQAVLNLISNAVKYTPEGGDVHVRVTPHEEKQTITISVRDTGVGIPEDALPHMFEKFFRVETSEKMAKGTGLGLNLVKHIAETVCGGAVRLTSKVGEGSTFEMELPLLT